MMLRAVHPILSFVAAILAMAFVMLAESPASAHPLVRLSPADLPQSFALVEAESLKAIPRTLGPTTRTVVPFETREKPGTIIISNADKTLHLVLGNGLAARYSVSVGRDGFMWTGTTVVGRKAKWPEWRPPAAMRGRDPSLPEFVPAGPYNPLGARAIYLFDGGRDTLYRIHGTNDATSIGGFQTSGCFRLTNADAIELFGVVTIGAKVIVR